MVTKGIIVSVLPFYLVFLVPLSVVAGYRLGGAFTFLTPILVFGVIPLVDFIVGVSTWNPTQEEELKYKDRLSFKLIPMLCAPVQVAVVFWGAYVVSLNAMTRAEIVGFVFSVGTSSGVVGINISHELQHRVNAKLEPFLARLMLWTVFYLHWAIEHVAGHHRNVATKEDPATARIGESFYAFWPRTVFGGFRNAWSIEQKRLKRKGQRLWGSHNRIIIYLLAELVLLVCLGAVFGPSAGLYFIIQSLIAISLLEVVNYIEHYGLLRAIDDSGTYERVNLQHSWNASNYLTNRFLVNLQRHSDHHVRPDRRYQLLRHHDESPQLPTGYAGMILLAVIPAIWRRVMDPMAARYRHAGQNRSAV